MSRILTRQLFQWGINSSDSYLINTLDTIINADMYLNMNKLLLMLMILL